MNTSDTASEVAYFTAIDYGVLVAILSCSLLIGIYFGFFSDNLKTAEDYLVGGHRMKSIPIAISLVARYRNLCWNWQFLWIFSSNIFQHFSQLSALSIVAIPAEIYSFGWQYFLIIPTLVFIIIAVNYLFLPVFYQNNIDNCYAVSWRLCLPELILIFYFSSSKNDCQGSIKLISLQKATLITTIAKLFTVSLIKLSDWILYSIVMIHDLTHEYEFRQNHTMECVVTHIWP